MSIEDWKSSFSLFILHLYFSHTAGRSNEPGCCPATVSRTPWFVFVFHGAVKELFGLHRLKPLTY